MDEYVLHSIKKIEFCFIPHAFLMQCIRSKKENLFFPNFIKFHYRHFSVIFLPNKSISLMYQAFICPIFFQIAKPINIIAADWYSPSLPNSPICSTATLHTSNISLRIIRQIYLLTRCTCFHLKWLKYTETAGASEVKAIGMALACLRKLSTAANFLFL